MKFIPLKRSVVINDDNIYNSMIYKRGKRHIRVKQYVMINIIYTAQKKSSNDDDDKIQKEENNKH